MKKKRLFSAEELVDYLMENKIPEGVTESEIKNNLVEVLERFYHDNFEMDTADCKR